MRRARRRVPHHDGVGAHGGQGVQCVHQGLALGDAGSGCADGNRVGAEAFGGNLETGAGAGGSFEKQVHDHLSAQRVEALERLVLEWLKIFSAGQNRFNFGPVKLFDSEQSVHQAPVPEATLSTNSTFSISSISWNLT